MRFFSKKASLSLLFSIAVVAGVFFLSAEPAQAIDWGKAVAIPFTWTFALGTFAMGGILAVLMYILVWVAQYNDFINSAAVTTGWLIIRDICNMFFILILLVIAFATTLNRENYAMKKLLPRFILAAIFINFSKLICGVIIDFAQVIMLTFVNGFRDIGPGNLTAMLGINDLLDIRKDSPSEANVFGIVASYVLAFLYVLVATVVILVILFVLIMRIVMIWIYVVLSPLAVLAAVLPKTQSYAEEWMKQFGQNVVTGPVLAFFIWLSFATVSVTSTGGSILGGADGPLAPPNQTDNEKARFEQPAAGLSGSGTPDGMLKIIISIGMLVGGLMVTQKIGGAAGNIAGKGLEKLKKGATKVRDFGAQKALVGAKATGRGALGLGSLAMEKTAGGMSRLGSRLGQTKTGQQLGLNSKFGSSLSSAATFAKAYRQDLKKTRDEEKRDKRKKTLEKFGMKENSMRALEDFSKTTGGKAVGTLMASANPLNGGLFAIPAIAAANLFKGEIQKFAVKREQKKNLKETTRAMGQVENERANETNTEKTKLRNERDKKFGDYDVQKKAELEAQKIRNEKEMNNSIGAGVSAPELDALKQSHQKSLDDIAQKYAGLRDDASKQYYEDAGKLEQDINAKYKTKISTAEEAHGIAQGSIERDSKLKDAERLNKVNLDQIQQRRDKEIATARKTFSGAPLVRDMEIKKINDKYGKEEETAKKTHADRLKTINEDYKDIPKDQPLRHVTTRMINKTGSGVDKLSNPNTVLQAATKEGTKELRRAKELVATLAEGTDVFDTQNSDFSGVVDINSAQTKMWENLASDDPAAIKAVANMAKNVRDAKADNKHVDPKYKKKMEFMMRGIAHITAKKPETKSALNTLMSALEESHPENKKVSSFAPKEK